MIIPASKIIYLVNVFLLVIGLVTSKTDPPLNDLTSAKETQSRILIEEFWTEERLRAAKEYIPEIDGNITVTRTEDLPNSNDPQTIVLPGAADNDKNGTSESRSARTLYLRTTGRVFWSCSVNQYYSCSASVIASDSRNLIVTAAQCVFDTKTLRWYTNCNWMFIPGYSYGNAPYGRWTANTFYALSSWTRRNPDYNYDISFVVMNRLDGFRIGDYLGYQGLYFNPPYGRYTSAFGYSSNINNGQTAYSCIGVPSSYSFNINSIRYRGQGLANCRLADGSGGGPWLQLFSTGSGSGYTYSVNSFTLTSLPNVVFGPMFDSTIQAVWNQLKGL